MAVEIIQVEHLTKRYGALTAVDDVSFSVAEGELFGFLGPNGAGKSTTIGVLCTLLRPSGGRVSVDGFDVVEQPSQVRRSIGIIFQDSSLDTQLTAIENMAFHARVYNLPTDQWRPHAKSLLKMVDLWERRGDLVKTFSGGMKRRLEIARGLLHQPAVLFLDEPTVGLDPQTREHIWGYLQQLRRESGTTVFLTTHYMDEAERCERVAIMDHGQIVALDTPTRLKALVGGDVVTLRTRDNAVAAAEIRERFALEPGSLADSLRLEVDEGESFIPQLVQGLSVPIETISLSRPSLEDVFIRLTGRAIRDEEAGSNDQMRAFMRARGRGR